MWNSSRLSERDERSEPHSFTQCDELNESICEKHMYMLCYASGAILSLAHTRRFTNNQRSFVPIRFFVSFLYTLSSVRPFHQPRLSPSLLSTSTLAPGRSASWEPSSGRKSCSTVATRRRNGQRKFEFKLRTKGWMSEAFEKSWRLQYELEKFNHWSHRKFPYLARVKGDT